MRTLDDVVDIISFGSDKPRRPPPRWLVVVLSIAVLAVTAVLVIDHRRAPGLLTTPVPSPTASTREAAVPPCLPVG
jgi:hypothetical protein